jgi:hypothetical protein
MVAVTDGLFLASHEAMMLASYYEPLIGSKWVPF